MIVHNPFTQVLEEPFDIEKETYTEWATLLREHVKPQLMLSGHMHKAYVSHIGSPTDHNGQPCPVVVASERSKEGPYIGGAFVLYPDRCHVAFTDHEKQVHGEETIMFSNNA